MLVFPHRSMRTPERMTATRTHEADTAVFMPVLTRRHEHGGISHIAATPENIGNPID